MNIKAFFGNEVKPSLGCTEPGAVALAAAAAAERLSGEPRHIHLRLSANIYKNGMYVGVPGTRDLRGNLAAAALGALVGDPSKGLEVSAGVTEDDAAAAAKLVQSGSVTQEVVPDVPRVYAEVEILRQGESASAVVAHEHDSLEEVRFNGKKVFEREHSGASAGSPPAYIKDLVRMSFAQIWDLAGSIDAEDEAFLLQGAEMNLKIAEVGLEKPWGLGVGHTLQKAGNPDDLLWDIKAYTAAAADVRMEGGAMTVMSSAGSGNHGLTAILPVARAAHHWGNTPRETAEALALSHLVTGVIKFRTGRLSPVCGCAVAAGAGAAAGIVRLGGGDAGRAQDAAANILASVMGMICDGAKGSCAYKVATAAGEAYTAAMVTLNGGGRIVREGVLSDDFAANARAVGELSTVGFGAADGVILRLMGP